MKARDVAIVLVAAFLIVIAAFIVVFTRREKEVDKDTLKIVPKIDE